MRARAHTHTRARIHSTGTTHSKVRSLDSTLASAVDAPKLTPWATSHPVLVALVWGEPRPLFAVWCGGGGGGGGGVVARRMMGGGPAAAAQAHHDRAAAAAAAAAPVLGRELGSAPGDGISNLRFSNYSDHLLVSSWDAKVRLYDASANVLKGQFAHRAPVLDCCFHDDSSGFTASADNTVYRYDFNTGGEDLLGTHDAPVRCVEYSHATGHVVTGSWDKTVRCWDPRGGSRVGTYQQPERVYSMSLVGHRLVVATAGRHITVYDLRQMHQPEQTRESSLKYQTRCVRCYPNGTGYALSSVEGRVAMEFFDMSETGQAKKYAFKCHRKSEAGRDTVYPVNAIAFHPIYGTFATGGCDGYVNVWDGNNKKRLYQYSRYPTSVAALSFSRDGRLLAVASSYTFEEGDKPHEPDAIFVRSVNEAEVKPKPKAYAPMP